MRFPHVDDTRRPMRRIAFHKRAGLKGAYLSQKHAQVSDISPEEIEARYQRRLAELRWERMHGGTEQRTISQ